MVSTPPRRWFQFSLLSLLLLISICSVGFAWLGRERRHEQAVQVLWQLGGHTSYGDQASLVYFWRHEDSLAGPLYRHVTDLNSAIRALRQMKGFTDIVLLENQRDWEPILRREFPQAKIEISHAGVI